MADSTLLLDERDSISSGNSCDYAASYMPNEPMFYCLSPANLNMRSLQQRVETFGSPHWPIENFLETPHDFASAGFYYLGDGDKVKCWYCNDGLEHWERFDTPWRQHSKWFPKCEFLLQKKGIDFVKEALKKYLKLV